jgi:hypothetical protein
MPRRSRTASKRFSDISSTFDLVIERSPLDPEDKATARKKTVKG